MEKRENVLSWASVLEEEAMQQALRASRLPFLAGHLALMPDAHFGMGATVGSVIPTKGAIIPAAVGVDIGCFSGDTKVPLLNGRQRTLQDLTAENGEYWVYSIGPEGKIVPGKARALKTRSNAELIRVVVSGGDEIICTPDHKFLLSDGEYREAKDLKFNDSLMPLYRKWDTRDGYESVNNGKGTSQLTHIMVYEALNGSTPAGHVVHHFDHIHFNNDPSNLVIMEKGEHARHHRLKGHSFKNYSPEFQALRLAGIKKALKNPEYMEKRVEVGTANITKYMSENPEHYAESVKDNGKRGAPFLARWNSSPIECNECDVICPNPTARRYHKLRKEHIYNHKVICTETLDYVEDVYCLQVEEHHNFALAAGVFVHNCGMIALETGLTSQALPENLDALMPLIEQAIPAGVGKGHDWDNSVNVEKLMGWPQTELSSKQKSTAISQFGTLGSGNHFVEVCLDERDVVWIVLHSGSRGIGNQLASAHITKAKGLMKQMFIKLEDPDLSYFVEGTDDFQHYMVDLLWGQEYALANREIMMTAASRSLATILGGTLPLGKKINCHHNYTQKENHHGKNIWVTRKGAIKADVGDLGVIPGSMGTRSYIVEGLGNPASYNSCSHGAGRTMSRSRAKKELSKELFVEQMAGKTWNSNRIDALIDEAPGSYKDIDVVMEDQKDLVRIVHTLSQILNYKG